jgi:transcription elongation factor Elf1
MKLILTRTPAFFVHDACSTATLSAPDIAYQRVGIRTGRRNLIGRRMQIDAQIRKLSKQYDASLNVYTIKALVDFPCVKCGKTLSASESIGQLDINSIVGKLNCQNCGVPLQVVQSEHEQEELSADTDQLSLTVVLACRNLTCERHEFAMRALKLRMQQLTDSFQSLQGPVKLSNIEGMNDVFAMISTLVNQDDPTKFRNYFAQLTEHVGRIDENLLKEVETQSHPDLGSGEKLSRSLGYLQDVLKEGVGGALGHTAGTFLFELIKHAVA